MSLLDDQPLHDFPDRAFRELLSDPSNLRDLIAVLLPEVVDRLDFARREILPRTFLLDDRVPAQRVLAASPTCSSVFPGCPEPVTIRRCWSAPRR